MTYYDHATAMAFELDRWSTGRIPRSLEREAIARAQRQSDRFAQESMASEQFSPDRSKPSVFIRCAALLRSIRFKDTLDTP